MSLAAEEPEDALALAAAARRERARRLKGIGFMCLAVALFSVLDGSAKWLGRDLPALQITFARYAVALVLIVVALNPLTVERAWSTRRPWMQGARGLALFGSTMFNFMAIRTLQLSEAMSIIFATPFLIAALSGPILGERSDWRRWVAIAVGFTGVLIVTRPGAEGVNPGVFWSVAGVCCYAVYAILTRILTRVDSTASMLVISALIPTVVLAPLMPATWVWPKDLLTWTVMPVLGITGAVGHFFLIKAYAQAPAPVVAPFIYTQIVWSTLIGFVVFAEIPVLNTIVGAGVVIGSGLYLIWRETGAKA
ncbi:DMT family transporter [Prosthecomicrobium sp. N25]|uniref:DMT family transporter n=1 Tax=Prosthecomicrobium sp. N25 TaxID=3129254 RepID=UPI003077136B